MVESPVWTTYLYDGLSRILSVTLPDGSATATSYSGNNTTVTDPAGVSHINNYDAAGRLGSVTEASGSPALITRHVYDGLDNILNVNQSGLGRNYSYDSLSRMTQASNPESGVINYTSYDANSNLLASTNGASITTTNTYDTLNRLSTKSYSDGTPQVTYTYDTVKVGEVSSIANSVSTTAYTAYDGLGRVTASTQTTAGAGSPYVFAYTYNRAGSLTSETYPSGRTVSYGYDGAARVNAVTGVLSGATTQYASGVSYASNGGMAQMTFGNSVVEKTSYSADRQQVSGITALSAGGSTLLALGFSHCPNYATSCTTNNGNMWQQTIQRAEGSWTQTYGYSDGMNRLTSVSETGPAPWTETYGYGFYGNRWVSSQGPETLTAETPTSASWFLTNNHISGWSYDGPNNTGGNVTSISSMQRTFAYDAENRQISAAINGSTTTYSYDGEGHRVYRSASGGTYYAYDAFGNHVAEYAVSNADSGTFYLTADTVGSPRLVTVAGGVEQLCYDYMPFGIKLAANGRSASCFASDAFNLKFTGAERDTESTLDYMVARRYSSAQGRFQSADGPFNDQNPNDPQSWNLFGYGRNNPLRYNDPSGKECIHSKDAIGQNVLEDDGKGCKELTDSGNTATVIDQFPQVPVYLYGNAVERGDVKEPGSTRTGSVQKNGRSCSAGSASAGQYVISGAVVAGMTAEFFSGIGAQDRTFGPDSSVSAVMAQSAGTQDALNEHYMTGATGGLYTFGGSGYVNAGANPVAQFVGSFRWSISAGILSLTNTTSFRSLTYDRGGQWSRHTQYPGVGVPMGNTHQTYNIAVTCQ